MLCMHVHTHTRTHARTHTHTELYYTDFDQLLQVSILLRDKAQLPDGHFALPVGGPVACGADIPGTIR